jgi:hypothetical protein
MSVLAHHRLNRLPSIAFNAGPPPGDRRHRTSGRLCELIGLTTAVAFAIPVEELTASSRRAPYVAFARQSAMYVAHVRFGLSFTEVGRGFGRDRTTAAYACRLIEDRRDDPAVDFVLASLESACDALRQWVQP